jgi:hypothetical protein
MKVVLSVLCFELFVNVFVLKTENKKENESVNKKENEKACLPWTLRVVVQAI